MTAVQTPPTSNADDSILLHICCAPCATYPVEHLREAGLDVRGFWYNPNIHPWQEHEARRASLVSYAARVGLPVEWQPGYDAVAFLRAVAGRETARDRCRVCYALRLGAAAARTQALGLPRFTTTLLISPYQDQDLIRAAGQEAAAAHGVEFYFENFRRGWSVRGQRVREYNLYRQQYCGCLFSEFERYTRVPIAQAGEMPLADL
ncbi:MAG: epoxyqueuosine reductase QueH [Anaerolineae bacterium]|jgi:predicted adenine nucleotide alpha hydrolase (AANH) superfamily ATPase